MKSIKQNAINMETKLIRITKLSRENPKMEFCGLIQHFNKENLIRCFHELDGTKAVGIDKVSKEEYSVNLEQNIENLIARMKDFKYYPAPVREVLIPKGNGKYRPLGISNIEDKIIQSMYAKILSAIYEPLFIEESFGFRPGRSCHGAMKSLYKYLNGMIEGVVIDIDLSNFFGTINHRKLIQILEMKIKDKAFIRYIVRMLRAGVLANGELRKDDNGSPQGSICSPVLANIFAHYCIDQWIKHEIPKYLQGNIHLVRYADDIVIMANKVDAPRIMKALKGRLARFSLQLNEEKTKMINFSRPDFDKTNEQEVFNFLGFTIYIGRSRNGFAVVKIKTASKTFARKLKDLTTWCKESRCKYRLKELWKTFQSKVRGHIQYYGVSHNMGRVQDFIHHARMIFFKWINRRSQKKSFDWGKFNLFESMNPLPTPKIVHHLF